MKHNIYKAMQYALKSKKYEKAARSRNKGRLNRNTNMATNMLARLKDEALMWNLLVQI